MSAESPGIAVGKKQMKEYEENPSVAVAAQKTKTTTKKITNSTGDVCMIVNEGGDVIAQAGFHEVKEVDRSQFIKFYAEGVTMFKGLSSPGSKVFELLYKEVMKNRDTDRFLLYHKNAVGLSRATFDRGMVELLAKDIIYKSTVPNSYFINVNFMFNGDRLGIVREYRLKEEYRGNKVEPHPELPL